jgi:translation initiation factor IF-2
MAKKRVHEIAKERGISSKEVIAVLQKAGLDVKASASSVDENDIAMAFNGGQAQPGERGDRGGPQPSQRPGTASSPPTTGAAPRGSSPTSPRPRWSRRS